MNSVQELDLSQTIDWVEYQIQNLELDQDNIEFHGSESEDSHTAMSNILKSLNELKGWEDYKLSLQSLTPTIGAIA